MEKRNKRICLIVGHTALSQGAVNFLGEQEYSFNSRIAEKVKSNINFNYCDIECKVFYRDNGGLRKVAKDITEWGNVDVSLEMHFNAFREKACGCECLITSDLKRNASLSQALALNLVIAIKENFDIRLRYGDGLKWVDINDRGAYNLALIKDAGTKIALLIEPVFGNFNTEESERFFRDEQSYIDLLVVTLTDFLDVKKAGEKCTDCEKLEKIREILDC